MEVTPGAEKFIVGNSSDYDRAKEVKEFDETKGGVKGLVDSGMVKIPRFFYQPLKNLQNSSSNTSGLDIQVPVIDFDGYESSRRMEIVNEIRKASETWGFFQMVNHGIPIAVINEMLEGIPRFHEQPKEVKMDLYSRDTKQRVRYYSNGDLLVAKAANWRDSIACEYIDGQLDAEALPPVCR